MRSPAYAYRFTVCVCQQQIRCYFPCAQVLQEDAQAA